MKYFTQELLNRFGSDNNKIANQAEEEWERKSNDYVSRLNQIKKGFPQNLKDFLSRFYFHDARVLSIGRENSTLHLAIKLDTPPKPTVYLQYKPVDDVKVIRHPISAHDQIPDHYWIYDEFDRVPIELDKLFRHSILLTNGVELEIEFREFSFAVAEPLPKIETLNLDFEHLPTPP